MWRAQIPEWKEMVHDTLHVAIPTAMRLVGDGTQRPSSKIVDITYDFPRAYRLLNELDGRLDRLSERGNCEMQLTAARASLAESRNLAQLTWMATIFIPLSFVTGLLA